MTLLRDHEIAAASGGQNNERTRFNMVLPPDDRRVNVFSGPDFVQSRLYYERLYQWLESEGVRQLHSFLMRRDLSDFDWGFSMKTPARQTMLENNRSVTETLFWELMEAPPFPAMTFEQIKREVCKLSEVDMCNFQIDETQLVKLLQNHATWYKKIKVKQSTPRPWVLVKDMEMNNQQVRESVINCGI